MARTTTTKITVTAADKDTGLTAGELRDALEGVPDGSTLRAQTTVTGKLTGITIEGVDGPTRSRIEIDCVNISSDGTAETVLRLPDGRKVAIPGGRVESIAGSESPHTEQL